MSLSRWLLTAALITPMLFGLTGCVPERETVFADPATTMADGVTVRVPRVTRSPDRLVVDVVIRNDTDGYVDLTRHYDRFVSVRLFHGEAVHVGFKQTTVSRTLTPERYTIRPGETETLRMEFAAAGVDTATGLTLQVDGRLGGQNHTWRLALPATGAEPPAAVVQP